MRKFKLLVFLLGLFAFIGLTKQTYAQDTANVTITYKLDGNVLNEHTTTPATSIGDVLTVPAKDIEGEFLFWTLNGAVRRDLGEQPSLRAISTMNLVAHYARANKKSVVYLDSNLQLLDVEYLETKTPTPPSQPNKPLSISEGWALITNYNNEVTPTLPEGNLVYYVAKYSLDTTSSPSVTLTLGENITATQTTNFNEVVIVEAFETVGGKAFSHYVDENNQILSKQRVYSFTLLSDMTISAVYETPELESVVNVRGPLELRSTHNTYVGQFELLENQTLIEYGFMFKQGGVDQKVPSNTLNTDVNEFMISFNKTENITDVKAYVTYVEGDVIETITNKVQVIEKIQLPAPVNGFGADPMTHPDYFVAIGPYGAPEGAGGGFIGYGFVLTNQETNVSYTYLVKHAYNAGSAFNLTLANLATQDIHLVPGTYKVELFARGNGETTSDSNVASFHKLMTVPKPNLAKPELSIVEEKLNWSTVEHAESYEVFINDESKGEQTSPYDLSGLAPGNYTLKVVASALYYNSSEAVTSYAVINEDLETLNAPDIITLDGLILSWNSVPNAVRYEIKIDDISKYTNQTSFDLSEFNIGNRTVTVLLIAEADQINYSNSLPAEYEVDLPPVAYLNPMTAGDQNDAVTGYNNGYYTLIVHTGHPPFQQENWSGQFKFVVKQNGNIVAETTGANGASLHTPGSETDFYGENLIDGETYTLEISLIAKPESGYGDSEPWSFDFSYVKGVKQG